MPLDFPGPPLTVGQTWTGDTNSVPYAWDGTKWVVQSSIGQLLQMPVISVLDHAAKGDGITDDTAAIQSVLNTYAGKAITYVPVTSSTYRTGALTLPSNTNLLIEGTLQALPGLAAGYVTASNVSNISISGFGTIDANGPAQTAAGGMAGLAISTCINVRVSGITLTNAFYWNMNVTRSSNVVFDGVTMTKGNSANEFAAGCDDCWLINCTIDGTGNGDYAFCFYGGVTNSGAIGNLVKNAAAGTAGFNPPGIGVLSDSGQTAVCANILIANNVVHDCAGPGISVLGLPTALATGIVISNNRLYNNSNKAGAIFAAGLSAEYCSNVTIDGNQISGSGSNVPGQTSSGIFLSAHADHIGLIGNHIYNIGAPGSNSAGIWTNASFVNVSGNYIYDSQTTRSMQYSAIGGGGTDNVWIGNASNLQPNVGTGADTVAANAIAGVWTVGGPGGAADHIMTIVGCSGHRAGVQYQAVGQPRWLAGTDGVADSGGGTNAGSNYAIASYNDANVLQPAVLNIARANGLVRVGSAISINNSFGSNPLVTTNWNIQGIYIGWNYTAGGGEGDFVNSHGSGGGGFQFYNVATSTSATPALLARIDNLGGLSMASNYQINSVQVVGPPIAGYGTPTGGVRTASFPGATATLAQTSAQLAQLILDLKTHGLLAT